MCLEPGWSCNSDKYWGISIHAEPPPSFNLLQKNPSCVSLLAYWVPLSISRLDPALPHCMGVNTLTADLLLPCCLFPRMFFFFLGTLHSSYDTGETLLEVSMKGCVLHKIRAKWIVPDYPFQDPPLTSLLWREWFSLPFRWRVLF